jgi:hypothetical protein
LNFRNHNAGAGSKFVGTNIGEARLKEGPEDAVATRKNFKSVLAFCAMALLAGALGYFMLAGKDSDTAEADGGKTTEAVAAAAGAQVLPTDPKLQIEPK